ncbi:MAG TPA: hypothetical protein VGF99_12280 [Myxococcota bacterium]
MNRHQLLGLAALLGLAGCSEKRLDVALQVTRATSLGDADLAYAYVSDAGDENGSALADVDGFALSLSATSVRFEVKTLLDASGFGRADVDISGVPVGGSVTVPVLVVPVGRVSEVSSAPIDLGGDACVAVDENGTLFMVGGSAANQLGYVYGGDYTVRSVGSASAVGGLGCGARNGKVAFVGGCSGAVTSDVTIVDAEGSVVDTFPNLVGTNRCGARAAMRGDGGFWVVDDEVWGRYAADGDGLDGNPSGFNAVAVEVTANDALVVLTDDDVALYIGDDGGIVDLGPATALGRQGSDALVLDGSEVKRVDNAATVVVDGVRGVASSRFVVVDGVFVGIDGSDVVVVDDGDTERLPMGRAHTGIAGLPGGQVLLAGGDGAGFDGFFPKP